MTSRISDLDTNFRPLESADGCTWYDAKTLPVEGRGWNATASFYSRLPARAESRVPGAVWELSQRTAGMGIRFVSDAPVINVRWEVTYADLGMPHMPPSGMSGVDLYGYNDGGWRWAGCGIPQGKRTTVPMGGALLPGEREYLLYLPLYNGVVDLAIGLPEGARIKAAEPRKHGGAGRKPFVVYGTSIVQGGCAARAGMGYVEILARKLDRPSINLGFSGNGRMEPMLAELLAELDVSAYVLDAVPNMTPTLIEERLAPFVATLRQARPQTPIVIVEGVTYQRAWLQTPGTAGHEARNAALRHAYRQLIDRGVSGLHWVDGAGLLGDDGLGTVDGVHPTDLGFHRMAQVLEPVLRPLV